MRLLNAVWCSSLLTVLTRRRTGQIALPKKNGTRRLRASQGQMPSMILYFTCKEDCTKMQIVHYVHVSIFYPTMQQQNVCLQGIAHTPQYICTARRSCCPCQTHHSQPSGTLGSCLISSFSMHPILWIISNNKLMQSEVSRALNLKFLNYGLNSYLVNQNFFK